MADWPIALSPDHHRLSSVGQALSRLQDRMPMRQRSTGGGGELWHIDKPPEVYVLYGFTL